MPNEALTDAYKSLNIITKELRLVMDDTQQMYHHLFVQTLDIHNQMQIILRKLKDAERDDLNGN